MRIARAALLGLIGLLGPGGQAALGAEAADGRSLIELCAQTADPSARGLEALRAACPGIGPAVQALGLASLLPSDWPKRLSPQTLADIARLSGRYAQTAPRALLSAQALRAIALELRPPGPPPSGWERFLSWLKRRVEALLGTQPRWLNHIPWHLGALGQRLLAYGLIVLVLAGVAVLVFMELRTTGLLGRRARSGPRPTSRQMSAVASAPDEDFSALESLPLQERPVLLLRLLVQALTRSRRLEVERPLTFRELVAHARFDNPGQREAFRGFALLAERARYGPRDSPPELPAPLVSGARVLREELLATPTAPLTRT